MKARLLLAIAFVVGQAMGLAGGAAAQRAQPPTPPSPGGAPSPQGAPWKRGGEPPDRQLSRPSPVASPSTAPLGQPGLSYGYLQTFGTTEAAYLEDSAHINHPYGLAADGSNIWIADSQGLRALKYSSVGTFLTQFGKAGFRNGIPSGPSGNGLDFVSAVKADGSGNVWLADADISYVLKFSSGGAFLTQLGQTWQQGTDNSHFSQPVGLAFDGAGNVYVSDGAQWDNDSGNDRIQIFDSSGNYLNTIGTTAVAGFNNNQFHGPRHIAIYGNLLYVADAGNDRVQIFNVSSPASPSYVATIGETGINGSDSAHLDHPSGVAVDASYIYVADTWNNRVQIFNRATQAYVATIGTGLGAGNSQFWSPSDVGVDAAGNIYVADRENNRVQQFNSSRAYVRTYGTTGVPYVTDSNHYNQPGGLAVAPDGSLYVTEFRGHQLLKLSPTGGLIWSIGQPGEQYPEDNAHFSWPHGVALDSAGRVYVVEAGNNRVQIFNPDGTYYATLGTGGGTGNDQFNGAYGVALDPADNIYVADRNNKRIQVYDHNRAYVATLGVTGAGGADNSHFGDPMGVAVDTLGNIYVVDNANHRVQVFDKHRVYQRTIGVSGVPGNDFAHLKNPTAVAVDSAGRTYVADGWGSRVLVFDNSGAFLTTIGNSGSPQPGQLDQSEGLTLDRDGNLYVADLLFHRAEKYSPIVPGWTQTNINGFGDQYSQISSLDAYGGRLYAGTYSFSGGSAQLWRAADGINWTPVMTNGFGVTTNVGTYSFMAFNSQLYAATASQDNGGAEIWRSSDGLGWTRVVSQGLGDVNNGAITQMAVFSGTLYAATASYTTTQGAEIWSSGTGNAADWTRVVTNGFGTADNRSVRTLMPFNGYLYATTYNWNSAAQTSSGGEIWRTDGSTWTQVNAGGFGDPTNYEIRSLSSFNGYLYAGTGAGTYTANDPAQLWRCAAASGCAAPGDWSQVMADGFGQADNFEISSLTSYNNQLYAVADNWPGGAQVWRTSDGTTWAKVGDSGFGNSNNVWTWASSSAAILHNRLYIGTVNSANGGQIWKKTVTADFTASPTLGAPASPVQFTNASGGDFNSSLWNFGDGITSTLTSPTHLYAAVGTYTVSLTVGDGVDNSLRTRTAYVNVRRLLFLPLLQR